MKKDIFYWGLFIAGLGLTGCTTMTAAATGYNEPYNETVVTQYKGVLADGRTVVVSAEEHDRIIKHITDVDKLNNEIHYRPETPGHWDIDLTGKRGSTYTPGTRGESYQLPPTETETWRTYKGAVWSVYKSEVVTKQRFVETEGPKGKISIGLTALSVVAVPALYAVSYESNLITDKNISPIAGAGIALGGGLLITGLLNFIFQEVKFWNANGVTIW